jgi:hypothetical protein
VSFKGFVSLCNGTSLWVPTYLGGFVCGRVFVRTHAYVCVPPQGNGNDPSRYKGLFVVI